MRLNFRPGGYPPWGIRQGDNKTPADLRPAVQLAEKGGGEQLSSKIRGGMEDGTECYIKALVEPVWVIRGQPFSVHSPA